MFIDYLYIYFVESLIQAYWLISHWIVFFLWICKNLSFSLFFFFYVIFWKIYCFTFNM